MFIVKERQITLPEKVHHHIVHIMMKLEVNIKSIVISERNVRYIV